MTTFIPSDHAPPWWDHQRRYAERHIDQENFAILWDTRVGKTRAGLETAARWYDEGRADAAVIISWPSGLHLQWLREAAEYVPERCGLRSLAWRTGHTGAGWHRELDALCEHHGLAVLSVNAEALTTVGFQRVLTRFLPGRKVVLIVDESDFAKTPGTIRTRAVEALARHRNIVARRILTATPATERPLEFFSQFAVLDWRILGHRSFHSFRNFYAVMETREIYQAGRPRRFRAVRQDDHGRPMYRNLDDLSRRMAPYSMVVRRSDVTDAPPQVHQVRTYEMSDTQRRVYEQIRKEFRTMSADGRTLTKLHVFQQMTAMQQVLSNRLQVNRVAVPCECRFEGCQECDGTGYVLEEAALTVVDTKSDARIGALRDELEANAGTPTIVWCRYRHEVTEVIRAVSATGLNPVRLDGSMTADDKLAAVDLFQSGSCGVIVGNQAAGGRGLRMDRAGLVVFFSNYFSYRTRKQALDRSEAVGKRFSTGVVDLVCADSIDEVIVAALANKREVSDGLLDNIGRWL